MRRFLGALVALAAIMAGMVGGPATAEAAYPVHDYELTYGATYTRGTVTFYGRLVRIHVYTRALAVSGKRATGMGTYASRTPHVTPPPEDDPLGYTSVPTEDRVEDFIFDVPADISGGANSVLIKFWAEQNGQMVVVGRQLVRR